MEINPVDINSWGRFVHARLKINISTPLKCGTMVVNGKGESVWVYFWYEKLPNFYYWYGTIGHVEDDCDAKLVE